MMCHGGSGPARSGPVAECRRRQVRIAPANAKDESCSSLPPRGAKRCGSVNPSTEARGPSAEIRYKRIRVAPSTTRSGLNSFGNPLSVSQIACGGGAAKAQSTNPENLVHHMQSENLVNTHLQSENLVNANLKTWTVHPAGLSAPNSGDPTAHQGSSTDSVRAPTMPAARVELKRSRSPTQTESQHKHAHGERALLLADGSSPRPPLNGCDSVQPESARNHYTQMHSD